MKNIVLSCLESRVENNRSLYARFLFAPFPNGNALTVGTALRRALLSQMESIAITALDIQGVTHEFSTIVGVRESVLELSLNFQRVVLRSTTRFDSARVGYLQIEGPGIVYANDLKLPIGVECVDPTQHIATLARDGLLVVKFLIEKGPREANLKRNNYMWNTNQIRKAKNALEKKTAKRVTFDAVALKKSFFETKLQDNDYLAISEKLPKLFKSDTCFRNTIPLEHFSSPINNVNFTTHTDDLSNQKRERIIFEIWTNGSIHPRDAIHFGLMRLLSQFSEFRTLIQIDSHSFKTKNGIEKSELDIQTNITKRLSFLYKSNLDRTSFLSSDLSNLSIALKTYMFLKQKGIHDLETILQHSSDSMLQLVNGNKNMFYDIKRCVSTLGCQFSEKQ